MKRYVKPCTTELIQFYKRNKWLYDDIHSLYKYYPPYKDANYFDEIQNEMDLEFLPLPPPLRVDTNGYLDIQHFQKNLTKDQLFNLLCSVGRLSKYEKSPMKKNMSKSKMLDIMGKLLFGNVNATKTVKAKFLFNLSPHFRRISLYHLLWYYQEHKIIQRKENQAPVVKMPCDFWLDWDANSNSRFK